ncbi:sulfate adenylyltransferase subunit 1 [Nonlabens agnitus]|uniref:sulfate adenylyltransferase n=1 Tax=Nonlabens agnitus TaxID=870484 RepID=A0A2S9WV45_9FLAO|nr:GTP-binding protein [Nonlabens agnitus]PRP67357.1 sulfate adenylyltransferase [Nonlabens agnitus]
MDVLKIATAGSVDDGKSTLIGRLLYDTQSLPTDKLEAIKKSSEKKGYDYLDLSLATDGLVAEREQGITIDVAHIYFSTPDRSYIIADSPGHVEYTRNMITGASTSKASIILIDARKGVVEQTFRHFYINHLLQTSHLIIAVNKMDLVDYEESAFAKAEQQFRSLLDQHPLEKRTVHFVPVSALKGENVVDISGAMPWYTGSTILEILSKIDTVEESTQGFLQVQNVIRPKTEEYHDYRGFAGRIKGAHLSTGDEITVLPSMKTSMIDGIYFNGDSYDEAPVGSSVSVTLKDEVNVDRGDVLMTQLPADFELTKTIQATICWMDSTPLRPRTKFHLQYGTQRMTCRVEHILSKKSTDFRQDITEVELLELNDIARIQLKLSKPIPAITYDQSKELGRFILIEPQSRNTAAVGFIE